MKTLLAIIFCSFSLSSFAINSAEVRVMSVQEKRDAGIVVTGDPRFPNVLPSKENKSKYSNKSAENLSEENLKKTNKSS